MKRRARSRRIGWTSYPMAIVDFRDGRKLARLRVWLNGRTGAVMVLWRTGSSRTTGGTDG